MNKIYRNWWNTTVRPSIWRHFRKIQKYLKFCTFFKNNNENSSLKETCKKSKNNNENSIFSWFFFWKHVQWPIKMIKNDTFRWSEFSSGVPWKNHTYFFCWSGFSSGPHWKFQWTPLEKPHLGLEKLQEIQTNKKYRSGFFRGRPNVNPNPPPCESTWPALWKNQTYFFCWSEFSSGTPCGSTVVPLVDFRCAEIGLQKRSTKGLTPVDFAYPTCG